MPDVFQLKTDVVIRKELFGCLCCDLTTGDYFQYNQDAFLILCEFQFPTTISLAIQRLRDKGLHVSEAELNDFLIKVFEDRLLNKNEINNDKAALILYKDKTDFEYSHLVAPATVTLYVSDFCSKRCLHCVTRSSPQVNITDELDYQEWANALSKLKDWGVFSLILTGGEPLLKKNIFDILHCADNLGFNISLLTDFDGLQEEHIFNLKGIKKLNYIQTSLDGATEKTHDYIRGKGSFKKAIKRLELLKNSGLKYAISTAVYKNNFNEINDIVNIYRKCKATYLYLNPLAPYGRAGEFMTDLLLSQDDLKQLAYTYYRLVSRENVHSGNAFWQNLTDSDVLNSEFNPFKDALYLMSTGAYGLSFDSKGDCYLDSKMKSEGLLKLGNVLQDNLEDMWTSPILRPLRDYYQSNASAFILHQDVLKAVEILK